MKGLHFNLISFVFCVVILVIAFFNGNNSAEFSMNFSSIAMLEAGAEKVSTMSLIFGFYFSGIVTGLLFMLGFVVNRGNSIRAYERKLEKTSVSYDASAAKIEVLENKIQVLEKALDDALRNK